MNHTADNVNATSNNSAELTPRLWIIHGPDCEPVSILRLKNRLSGSGCEIFTAAFDGRALPALPSRQLRCVIFYFPNAIEASVISLATQIKTKFRNSSPALLAVGPPNASYEALKVFDSVLRHPVHPAQLSSRVSSLFRLQTMSHELMLRQRTLAAHFDLTAEPININLPNLKILFVGKPVPEFMSVLHALDNTDADLTAAFTSFTAFDYLHSLSFDAVVVSGLNGEEPAHSIAATMRKNSRLYNVPVLLLSPEEASEMSLTAHQRGITDVISAFAEPNEISGRILELARGQRAYEHYRRAILDLPLGSAVHKNTGLFTQTAFHAHLDRVKLDAARRNRSVSVGVMRLSIPPEHGSISDAAFFHAKLEIERMIASVIRVQDFAARLSADCVGIIFPDTRSDDVQSILTRLSELIQLTAFDDVDRQFNVTLTPNTIARQYDNWQSASA